MLTFFALSWLFITGTHFISPVFNDSSSVKQFRVSSSKIKWLKSRVPYYSNSTATFNILTCGEIHLHPGPEPSAVRPDSSTNSKNPSHIRCFYQIARSIKSGSKLREFQDSVYVNQYDVVAVTETWLTSDVSDSELLPWGYDIYRCDRKSLAYSAKVLAEVVLC